MAFLSLIVHGFSELPLFKNSVVGTATRYGLDCLGIKIGEGEIFCPVHTGPGAHPASYTMGTGSFPGVKWPGHGIEHLPPPSTGVKRGVELYLYSPSGPSWSILG